MTWYENSLLGYLILHTLFRWFAGKQIRNVGSIGGNIITGSPISDINPIFMASGCKLTLASKHKKRTVDFDQNFYTGYRKSILEPNEILVSITIPFTRQNEYFVAFKQVRTHFTLWIYNLVKISYIKFIFESSPNQKNQMTKIGGSYFI